VIAQWVDHYGIVEKSVSIALNSELLYYVLKPPAITGSHTKALRIQMLLVHWSDMLSEIMNS